MQNVELFSTSFMRDKVKTLYKVFENSVNKNDEITLAYSGGKDSTLLSLLFYEWLKTKPDYSLNIHLLHNDTMSEIDSMESWARLFLHQYKKAVEEISNSIVDIQIKEPKPIDSFYWRAIIRGYPAPSFNFRWCVHLLKEKPAKLDSIEGRLLTGLREDESSERKNRMKNNFGSSCSAPAGGCMAYYYSKTGNKLAPLRDWKDDDVWAYLWKYKNNGRFDISPLFDLYPNPKVRYGCWHCTLASVQWGLHINSELNYFEAVRVLYRKFSDLPYLRIKKSTGYSNLGPLNAAGRSILLNMITAAEYLSGIRLYGLETEIEGKTLRDILYEIPEKEASKVIRKADPNLPRYRYIPIKKIRNLHQHSFTAKRAMRDVQKLYENERAFKIMLTTAKDPFKEVLDFIATKI